MELDKERLIEIWKRKLEEQEKYVEEVRAIKHDMQAHLIVLQYYLEEDKFEDAKMYIKTMRDTHMIQRRESNVDTGDALVNALIEDYINRNREITLFCEGRFTNEVKIPAYDFCVLFSNLMSNAVEACEKLTTLQKVIHIKLREENGKLEIMIENPKEWEIVKEVLGKKSTKKDSKEHGYGIKNIKEIVAKYGGHLDFEILKDTFRVKIEIPLKRE